MSFKPSVPEVAYETRETDEGKTRAGAAPRLISETGHAGEYLK